ncbi:snurportin-1 [Iris pallida]|uniref:Snurportin-1 n=1 Tax=Iris pallida TaxID=29817 RepID=A0AAX6IJM9_IRIPA|nr:snurportin-1 [Iris pallida]KAJ6853143.1 snurportin-1 [Iris pallida]
MAPHDLRRPFKRAAISDQQRRRDIALIRQSQHRSDSQNRARNLASSVVSLQPEPDPDPETLPGSESDKDPITKEMDVVEASRLKGSDARRWFARQLMLPEWMIDVPPNLDRDWYVFPRPAGQRCFVVSSNGTTVSRLRNGSILHHFPSSLPCGARRKDVSGPSHAYCILDCIFHEPDQTYYVIDMLCWRGYSLYDCNSEFRFFWLNSKLGETGAGNPPSAYHKYRFTVVPIYDCTGMGLHTAYTADVPYVKDGLLFYNKHALYQTGNTPLALIWKDEHCSQYVIDTDSQGHVPAQQQVVLELQDDGRVTTSDELPVVFGCIDGEFQQKSGLRSGNLLRFSIKDEAVRLVDGKLEIGEIQFIGKSNRARAFADSYSKVLFQYAARHAPVRFADLTASIQSNFMGDTTTDIEMAS